MVIKNDIVNKLRQNISIDKDIERCIYEQERLHQYQSNKELLDSISEYNVIGYGNTFKSELENLGSITDFMNISDETAMAQTMDRENIKSISKSVLIESAKRLLKDYAYDYDLGSVSSLVDLMTEIQGKIVQSHSDEIRNIIALSAVEKLLRLKDADEADII